MNTLGYEKLRSAVKIIPEEWVRRGTASGKLPWQQVEKVGSLGTVDQTEPAHAKQNRRSDRTLDNLGIALPSGPMDFPLRRFLFC